ncbi:MAG: DUF1801 domain-containing protein [Saprospiraceae bacterium]|nr:DUF1801 domain-containing protein [Saprospiraceae bacterium]
MPTTATTPQEYVNSLPEDRKEAIQKLREVISANIPEGFEECINYGMIGYVVPHSIYPSGYHVDNKLPLPFMNVASQKSHIAVYHSGVYANEELNKWFQEEYSKKGTTKLNMGKSCIRFKKPQHIPYDLIGELASKLTVQQWIDMYESQIKR